jgi:hypothetical protein
MTKTSRPTKPLRVVRRPKNVAFRGSLPASTSNGWLWIFESSSHRANR